MQQREMLILAIDTSGSPGGITLAEAGVNSFRAIESAPISGGTFSAQLVPTLAALLKKHGCAGKDLGGFAAASGPGSFTGLRVGLSAIKGLAEVLRKPIATVSVLEGLALSSAREGEVAAALDARRSEIFVGMYLVANGNATWQSEELVSQASFLEIMRKTDRRQGVTSDASLATLASRAGLSLELVARPGSEAIAVIGARKLLADETVTVEALDANYLRRSDAEIFSKGPR
jgi:tRNA threonylcarbamoyladenosine biosynthesis protein TsaB